MCGVGAGGFLHCQPSKVSFKYVCEMSSFLSPP
jgi:hypothetical protein